MAKQTQIPAPSAPPPPPAPQHAPPLPPAPAKRTNPAEQLHTRFLAALQAQIDHALVNNDPTRAYELTKLRAKHEYHHIDEVLAEERYLEVTQEHRRKAQREAHEQRVQAGRQRDRELADASAGEAMARWRQRQNDERLEAILAAVEPCARRLKSGEGEHFLANVYGAEVVRLAKLHLQSGEPLEKPKAHSRDGRPGQAPRVVHPDPIEMANTAKLTEKLLASDPVAIAAARAADAVPQAPVITERERAQNAQARVEAQRTANGGNAWIGPNTR